MGEEVALPFFDVDFFTTWDQPRRRGRFEWLDHLLLPSQSCLQGVAVLHLKLVIYVAVC